MLRALGDLANALQEEPVSGYTPKPQNYEPSRPEGYEPGRVEQPAAQQGSDLTGTWLCEFGDDDAPCFGPEVCPECGRNVVNGDCGTEGHEESLAACPKHRHLVRQGQS